MLVTVLHCTGKPLKWNDSAQNASSVKTCDWDLRGPGIFVGRFQGASAQLVKSDERFKDAKEDGCRAPQFRPAEVSSGALPGHLLEQKTVMAGAEALSSGSSRLRSGHSPSLLA